MSSSILKFMKTVKRRRGDDISSKYNNSLVKRCRIDSSITKATTRTLLSLPNEILFRIMNFMDLKSLGVSCLVSKALRNIVISFLYSEGNSQKVSPEFQSDDEILQCLPMVKEYSSSKCLNHYFYLGILVKKFTCLYSTKERLKHVERILDKLHVAHVVICSSFGNALAYGCYGEFLHAFVAGWEANEKIRAFEVIRGASLLHERIEKVVKAPPGQFPQYERYIRVFCVEIFLKRSEAEDVSLWLHLILKPWAMCFQAKILYIIYGPTEANSAEELSWDSMLYAPVNRSNYLNDLGLALKMMNTDAKERWTTDDVVSLLTEITHVPSEWDLENVAQLLRSCGDALCYDVLGNKVMNGRKQELSCLLFYLWQSGVDGEDKVESNNDWFLSMLRHVSSLYKKEKDRSSFLKSLFNIWEETTQELIDEQQSLSDSQAQEESLKLRNQLGCIKSLAFKVTLRLLSKVQ